MGNVDAKRGTSNFEKHCLPGYNDFMSLLGMLNIILFNPGPRWPYTVPLTPLCDRRTGQTRMQFCRDSVVKGSRNCLV